MAYLRAGDYSNALADFEKCVRLQPENAYGYSMRGRVLVLLGRSEEAARDLDRAVELSPTTGAYDARSWNLLQMGRVDEAIRDADKVVALDPSNAWWYTRRAFVLSFKPDQCERALADLSKAAEMSPNAALTRLQTALVHVAGFVHTCPEHYDQRLAMQAAEKGIAMAAPYQQPWGQWVFGMTLYRNGRFREAIEALENSMPALEARAEFFLAMAKHRIERTKEARSHYDRAVAWTDERAPNDPQRRRFKEEAARVLGIAK